METCTEPYERVSAEACEPAAAATPNPGRWTDLVARWGELRERVDSEWSAAYEALRAPGTEPARKWLGWALYRLATRVNPEIRD